MTSVAATQPAGYVTDSTDCNDSNAAINPAASDANCDGIDNNCSGATDEGYVGQAQPAALAPARQRAAPHALAALSRTAARRARRLQNCNNIDDDCDGTVDDGYVSQSTTCGVGACAATGSTSCVGGSVVDSCTPGAPTSDANCDGIDNDCDGTADDGYVSQSRRPAVLGPARQRAAPHALAAQWSTAARRAHRQAMPTATASIMTATVRPMTAMSARARAAALGPARQRAAPQCVGGSVVDSCAPGAPTSDANCDGIDNDCDGTADDGYVSQSTSCGVGACAATGSTSCVGGSVVGQLHAGRAGKRCQLRRYR